MRKYYAVEYLGFFKYIGLCEHFFVTVIYYIEVYILYVQEPKQRPTISYIPTRIHKKMNVIAFLAKHRYCITVNLLSIKIIYL